jgi:hypothetical protein
MRGEPKGRKRREERVWDKWLREMMEYGEEWRSL